jgi:dephospho-CoA kinase
MSKVIGLTGGAGAGKSSVASFWGERNPINVIDADAVCRLLLVPEAKGWLALKKILHEKYFQPDKTINRPLLRVSLFADDDLRSHIDKAIHPLVRQEIFSTIKLLEAQGHKDFLVEVPLLFEAGWEDDFDEIVVVFATREKCMQRLLERDTISEAEAEAMLRSQLPLEKKMLRADHVVDNSGLWSDTCVQLMHLEGLLWNSKK